MNATKRLTEELKAGSYTAFERLYDLYSGMLYGFALDLTKSPSEAEDIMADVVSGIRGLYEKRAIR
jgi:DNA-directed RNA polymerase specialized sigma24 family protein